MKYISDAKVNQLNGINNELTRKYEKSESRIIQLFGKTSEVAFNHKYSEKKVQKWDEEIKKMAKKDPIREERIHLMEE